MRLAIRDRFLDLSNTRIMGILNVTPDSFFDGGCYCTIPDAIDQVAYMISYGADLIDIGGESTRPGSRQISDIEEAERVLPIIRAIAQRFDIFISVNTSSALVVRESAVLGVHLINDIRSLTTVGIMQEVINYNLPVCLMHMQGSPKTMQDNPIYSVDIIDTISDYFHKRIQCCENAGIKRNQLLLDPGFGFGKSLQNNYQLLSNLKRLHHFGLPLLVGMSRKSMLNYDNRYIYPQNRLIGSIACAVIAAEQGVHIIRVHDVKETAEALQVVKLMLNYQNKKEN